MKLKDKNRRVHKYRISCLQDKLLTLAAKGAIIYSVHLHDVFVAFGGSAHDI